jgi:hypothetical protein
VEVNFVASNPYNPAWKTQNYGLKFQKQYSNPTGAQNENNFGANHGNHPVENAFKTFIQAQTDQNNMLTKIAENHDNGKLSNQALAIRNDVQVSCM